MELMKRGGRKKRQARATQSQKVKQSQVVNVKVHVGSKPRAKKAVGDTVMLLPDRMKLFKAKYAPAEPIRAAGPGFFYANIPAPAQASSYANAPTAIRPLSSGRFTASADHSKDANQNKEDDIRIAVNPSGIVAGVKEVRALPSALSPRILSFEQAISNAMPFVGRPVGPPANEVDEVRAIPSEGAQAFARFPFPLLHQDRAEQKRERDRDVIADRNRLGALMEVEKQGAAQGASEEERAALYRENMRRGGRLSLF